MTFSIVARCAETGQFGLAISSSSPAVAARCAFARAGVGAVATQNVTNPALGPAVLDRLEAGARAKDAVIGAIADEAFPDYRQVIAVDGSGEHGCANATPRARPSAMPSPGIWPPHCDTEGRSVPCRARRWWPRRCACRGSVTRSSRKCFTAAGWQRYVEVFRWCPDSVTSAR